MRFFVLSGKNCVSGDGSSNSPKSPAWARSASRAVGGSASVERLQPSSMGSLRCSSNRPPDWTPRPDPYGPPSGSRTAPLVERGGNCTCTCIHIKDRIARAATVDRLCIHESASGAAHEAQLRDRRPRRPRYGLVRVEARRRSSPAVGDCRIQSPTCASWSGCSTCPNARRRSAPTDAPNRPAASRSRQRALLFQALLQALCHPLANTFLKPHPAATRRHVPIGSSLPPSRSIAGGAPRSPVRVSPAHAKSTRRKALRNSASLGSGSASRSASTTCSRSFGDRLASNRITVAMRLRHGKSSPGMCRSSTRSHHAHRRA